jgi:predicted GIY-YIG superfamily endonuclease
MSGFLFWSAQNQSPLILSSSGAQRRSVSKDALCSDLPTRDEAFGAERQIKGWGRAKKEALIAGGWALVSELAKKRRQ